MASSLEPSLSQSVPPGQLSQRSLNYITNSYSIEASHPVSRAAINSGNNRTTQKRKQEKISNDFSDNLEDDDYEPQTKRVLRNPKAKPKTKSKTKSSKSTALSPGLEGEEQEAGPKRTQPRHYRGVTPQGRAEARKLDQVIATMEKIYRETAVETRNALSMLDNRKSLATLQLIAANLSGQSDDDGSLLVAAQVTNTTATFSASKLPCFETFENLCKGLGGSDANEQHIKDAYKIVQGLDVVSCLEKLCRMLWSLEVEEAERIAALDQHLDRPSMAKCFINSASQRPGQLLSYVQLHYSMSDDENQAEHGILKHFRKAFDEVSACELFEEMTDTVRSLIPSDEPEYHRQLIKDINLQHERDFESPPLSSGFGIGLQLSIKARCGSLGAHRSPAQRFPVIEESSCFS